MTVIEPSLDVQRDPYHVSIKPDIPWSLQARAVLRDASGMLCPGPWKSISTVMSCTLHQTAKNADGRLTVVLATTPDTRSLEAATAHELHEFRLCWRSGQTLGLFLVAHGWVGEPTIEPSSDVETTTWTLIGPLVPGETL